MSFNWTKQARGFYTLDGSDYAVVSSFADIVQTSDDAWTTTGVEWAVVRFTSPTDRGSQDGENIDWYDTMREAKIEAERMAAR